jgi:hypothetical protein
MIPIKSIKKFFKFCWVIIKTILFLKIIFAILYIFVTPRDICRIKNKYIIIPSLLLNFYAGWNELQEYNFQPSDYPGIGNLPKGNLPQGTGAPGNASPLPLASNSAAASSQEPAPAAQGGADYCPGGSEAECINFCPPEDKVFIVMVLGAISNH